jgi:uncharacterized membrane protein
VDELLLGLLGLLVVGVIAVAPLVAIYLAWDMRKRFADLQRRMAELEQRAARADWWIAEIARRTESLGEEGTSETNRVTREQESTSETARFAPARESRTSTTGLETPHARAAAHEGPTSSTAMETPHAIAASLGEGPTSITGLHTPKAIAASLGEGPTSTTGMHTPKAIAAFHDAPTIPVSNGFESGTSDGPEGAGGIAVMSPMADGFASEGSTSETGLQTPLAIARSGSGRPARTSDRGAMGSERPARTSDRGAMGSERPARTSDRAEGGESATSTTGMQTPRAIAAAAGESATSATGLETPRALAGEFDEGPSVTRVDSPQAIARSGSSTRPGPNYTRSAGYGAPPHGAGGPPPPATPAWATGAGGPPPPPPPAAAPREAFDFEKLVGVRLFAWLGGLGLFIGAAFFLEYSIEHDLIPPPMRIGIGLIVGALAVLVGDMLREKADRAGQALGGAGIATLYASLFAARTLYELLPTPAAFGGMAFVTVLAGVIAVRRDAFMLAVIALVGGFATPVLLSTGEDHRYALFGYLGLLDAGVLYVAAKRRWIALTALGFIATTIIYAGWASEYLDNGGVPFALGTAALFAALFAFGTRRPAPEAPAKTPVRAALFGIVLAAPFVAALSVGVPEELRPDPTFFAGYLCVLLLGNFVMAERWGAPFSLEIGAALTVLALTSRVAPDILGDAGTVTFLAFSAPALLLLGIALFRQARAGAEASASPRRAAAIALGGSWFVVGQAFPYAEVGASIAPYALYTGAHVAGYLALGLTLPASRWLAAAHALWVITLLTITQHYEVTRLDDYVPFIVVPMFVFFGLPLATERARRPAGWISGALSLVTHYAVLYGLARTVWSDLSLGAGAIGAAILALGMLSFARQRIATETPSGVLATLGAVTLAFLTAAVPITLSKQWITVAWGLEAAALAWLYLRMAHRGLLVASALLAVSTIVRLVANPSLWEYHPRSGVIVFNWYLYTFGLPALAFFAAAYLLRGDPVANRFRYPAALWFAGGTTMFVLLNVEIADAYSTGQTIGFHMGASLGEDMTYSLGWGVFGVVTLVIGMMVRGAKVRVSALAVLLLAIGKVFLHDLWHLGALYRVGSMVGLAIALLAVSFLTQRFILRGDRS